MATLRIDILTLFPGMFESVLNHSILRRAREKKKLEVVVHDIRDYATDKHRTCDDRPFGGGPGMVLKPGPIDRLARKICRAKSAKGMPFLFMSPAGKPFRQAKARKLARCRRFAILCGHYEGVDERVIRSWVTEEISVGDYVLTGGELPAMTVVDAVARLIPGVLGNEDSNRFESFSGDLLEYAHYTRPAVFRGQRVPPELLTGNHRSIEAWRAREARRRTAQRRPDLLES